MCCSFYSVNSIWNTVVWNRKELSSRGEKCGLFHCAHELNGMVYPIFLGLLLFFGANRDNYECHWS